MLLLLLLQMDVPFLDRWVNLCVCWGRGCFLLHGVLWCPQQHAGDEACCVPLVTALSVALHPGEASLLQALQLGAVGALLLQAGIQPRSASSKPVPCFMWSTQTLSHLPEVADDSRGCAGCGGAPLQAGSVVPALPFPVRTLAGAWIKGPESGHWS